jgi:beta-glucosidase
MAKMTAPKSRTPKTAVPLYKRTRAPAALRVKDLLTRMTLEEKASQMLCI